jgi:hypothetical protein
MSALRVSTLMPALAIVGIILLAMAMLDIDASAHGVGAGARGGNRGVSFGRGVGGASVGRGGLGFSHGGSRSGFRSFSAPRGGHSSIGSRSFGGNRFVGRTTTTGSLSRAASISHAANVARAHQVFGNRVITNAAFQSARVPFRFQGRFFGSPWPWWWGGHCHRLGRAGVLAVRLLRFLRLRILALRLR